MPRVLVTVPTAGRVRKEVQLAISRILATRPQGIEVEVQLPTWRPLVHNLHRCRLEALDGGFDYWLSIDDDNPPQRNPLELVELGLDVVGCPTPVYHTNRESPDDDPVYLNALDAHEDGYLPVQATRPEAIAAAGGLVEVDAIGGGCFLVARRVLEAVPAPFHRTWTDDGLVELGNDYSACRRWKAAGFRIWAHFAYVCEHFVTVPLLEADQRWRHLRDQLQRKVDELQAELDQLRQPTPQRKDLIP